MLQAKLLLYSLSIDDCSMEIIFQSKKDLKLIYL